MSNKTATKQRAAAQETPEPIVGHETQGVQPDSDPVDGAEAEPTGHQYSRADLRPDLVERLRNRHMPTGRGALVPGEIIKRRTVSFEIDGVECEPDMFTDEAGEYITFKVTMKSLSSAQEIQSLQGIKDGTAAPMMMAKWALFAINDRPLAPEDRDFYWECLGTGGRQICLMAFHELGAASEASMGKYLTSRSGD